MEKARSQRDGTVDVDFMTDCERQLRTPLDVWAGNLSSSLESISRDGWSQSRVRSAAAHMNLAALVVANAGDLPSAERLCRTQLTWLAQVASESGDVSVLGSAVQPWVNLGRLHVLTGSIEESLPHFRLAEHLRDRKPVRLGPCRIQADMWQPLVAAEPDLPDVLWNVFVLDQLKAHLRTGDPARALSAAVTLREAAPAGTYRYIVEGEIIALLRSSRAEDALQLVAQAGPATTSDEIAFLLHQIAAATSLRRSEDARRLATGLSAFVTQSDLPSAEPATFLRQLKQLAYLLERLGEPHYALAVHLHGMRTCHERMDEPLFLNFIEGALRLAPEHGSASHWRSAREDLLASSLYAEVRRRRGASAALDHPSLRELVVSVEATAARVGPYVPAV
ncbi:hypothetical protein [Streptomyces capillispiralis]|uniref:Uncharacterized protein n=1 Tax=Streptomyces capillispiralis TaxID=68182 RepID=A0A561TS38_9ACTN|nr:hypothetical protein [Streptomyces capillispiralis]TWF89924.1 hypothetical protein FHX78_116973 [Streptomyces capillispiralis]